MTNQNLREIQDLIGYSFRNTGLLRQAFIRRSYTQEHSDHQNNEVLEFVGDKVLDAAVVRYFASKFGRFSQTNGEFVSDYNEGKLTELKQKLISKRMLAHRIDVLGINCYLVMGNGDKKNNVQEDLSVKEDLFEAILGAVALDSNWNWEKIDLVLDAMLPIGEYVKNGFDTNQENFVALIQEWCQKYGRELPQYFYGKTIDMAPYTLFSNRGITYSCTLYLPVVGEHGYWGTSFKGEGKSKLQARMDAAEKAYRYLEEQGLLSSIEDVIGQPELEKAINQLQELAQKGYFSLPIYTFSEEYDKDGNPVWFCKCYVREYLTCFMVKNSSKKLAKKEAALGMIKAILKNIKQPSRKSYREDDCNC